MLDLRLLSKQTPNNVDENYQRVLRTFSKDKQYVIQKLVREGKLNKSKIYNSSVNRNIILEDFINSMGLNTDDYELIVRV